MILDVRKSCKQIPYLKYYHFYIVAITDKIARFNSLSEEKEFVALHAKRSTILANLSNLKKSLDGLCKDNPVLRSFERIETKIDRKMEQLEAASDAVCSYFTKMGGDPLNDSEYDQYCDVATNLIGEIEILRESYHDILKAKGLI